MFDALGSSAINTINTINTALSGVTLRHTLTKSASFRKDLLRVREDGSGVDLLFDDSLYDGLQFCLKAIINDMQLLEVDYRTKYPDAPLYLYLSDRPGRNMVILWRLSKRHAESSSELASRLSKSWFKQYLSFFDKDFVAMVEQYDKQRLRLNMLLSSTNHQIKLLDKYK